MTTARIVMEIAQPIQLIIVTSPGFDIEFADFGSLIWKKNERIIYGIKLHYKKPIITVFVIKCTMYHSYFLG